ncbi:MAG: tetratricopeptide repeat protein [Thermodesulfobacteriota bacterium]
MGKNILKLFFFAAVLLLFTSCSGHEIKQIPEQLKQGDQRLARGNILLKQGNSDEAGRHFLKAYKAYSLADDLQGCGASLTGLAISLFSQARKSEAELFLDKAKNCYKASRDTQSLDSFYITKSLLYLRCNETEKGEKTINKVSPDTNDERLDTTLAFLELKKNNTEKAYQHINRVNPFILDNKSFFYYTKGLIDMEIEDYISCEKNLLKALELDKNSGSTLRTASDLEALFNLYKKQGNIEKAENYLLRALKIYTITDNKTRKNILIRDLKNLGENANKDMSVEKYFLDLWENQ